MKPVPFKAPLADILFSLRHVARADRLEGWSDARAHETLARFADFAQDVLAPLNAVGDACGARLEDGQVKMPEGFGAAYARLADEGWQGLGIARSQGGQGQPVAVCDGVSEIFSGANHALQMLCSLSAGVMRMLYSLGSAEQQKTWITRLARGEVLATMCVSETQAGSDLSAISCRAQPVAGSFRITGEKKWISGGGQDMSQAIVHFVLARTGTPQDGASSLSLFLCPGQKGVRVTGLAKKLGLHASPSCDMVFEGADGELVGRQGKGMQALFALLNHARIDVGLQGVAHATRAAHIAAHHAARRVQGRRPDGGPARLHDHADVRHMLDEQQILALGTRSMCHIARVEIAPGTAPALARFIVPLCKIAGSEAGIRAADLGIQILGGRGYLADAGLGQIWRDVRVTAIYEGANGVLARNLATRGVHSGGGAHEFAALIGRLAGHHAHVARRLEKWREFADCLAGAADPSLAATSFAAASVDLFRAAAWSRIEEEAAHHTGPADIGRLAALMRIASGPERQSA